MTRKLAWAGFSFWAALALSAIFKSGYNRVLLLAALGLGIIAFAALDKYRAQTVTCVLFFTAGILVNTAYTNNVYDKLTVLDGEVVTINGYVKDMSVTKAERLDRVVVCGKVNGKRTEISFFLPADDYHYFDEISVTGRVNRITDSVKFQGESYYYSKSVFLQGSLAESCERSGRCLHPVLRDVREYRDKLFMLINEIAPENEGAFLSAMLCGDKSEMTESMKESIYRCGLGHIFAVSGTHLVIAAAVFSAVISRLVRIRKLEFLLSLIEIWGFAVFAGMSVTVVRAAVMMTLSSGGFLFGRKSDCANSLGLCALLLTVSQPYCAISPSFVLSFTAVFAIGVITPRINENAESSESFAMTDKLLGTYVVPTASLLFFTAPVSAAFFGGVSVAAVISNILLVPLCVISLQLCFTVVLTGGIYVIARPLITWAALSVKPVLWSAKQLSRIKGLYVSVSSYKAVFTVLLLTAFIPVIYGILTHKRRAFTLVCLGAVCVWTAASNIARLLDDTYRVTILTDGESSAYILSSGSKAAIFDVGSAGSLDRAIQSELNQKGFDELEFAFISERGVTTASGYEEELFLQPGRIFITDEPKTHVGRKLSDKLIVLPRGSVTDLGDHTVTCSDDGFLVKYNDDEMFFGESSIVINGAEYDLSDQNTLLETDFETLELRSEG